MNPNLTQSRRGAEKEGSMVVSTVKYTQQRLKRNHMFPWLARRCRPKSQARARRLQCQEKKEFAVAFGEPDKQDSGQQAANSTINSTPLQEMSK